MYERSAQRRREWPRRTGGRLLCIAVGGLLFGSTAAAQDAVIQDFKTNCASCHTIGGGRLTGPDLKNVEERKDRAWLIRFVQDPAAVIKSGDPYAAKILEEARGVPMPGFPPMPQERAAALLDLIAAESKLEKSQFAGVQVSDRPLTEEDVERGRDIFLGRVPLTNGGAACVSCHAVSGLGGLGGGHLGPDLTKIFEDRQGRKGLVAWLSAPATKMMQATFRDHPFEAEEILALTAYFKDRADTDAETHASGTLLLVLLAFAGTVVVLFLMGKIWRHRLRAVRQTLTQPRRTKVTS